MAGEGISSLILLTASIIVAAIVASAIFVIAYHYKGTLEDRERIEEQYLKSKILIINDLAYSPYNESTGNITLYVKNIGYTILELNHTVLLVNGTPYSLSYPLTITPLNSKVWAPQVVVKIQVHLSSPLRKGDYIATVIADYGVKDTITFRV